MSNNRTPRRGVLLIVASPSGAGKTSLCRRLMADHKGLELSVSMTTRGIRPGEVDGRDYHFVTHEEFQRLIDAMFETMYAAPGIGLAATQVDAHHRFMVIDVSEGKDQPLVFVNPQILARQGEQVYQEGCLSVPGIFADVTRADAITVRYLDRDGGEQELATDGLLAVCIQHEMDHLEGKLFVDYLSPLKREMVRKKLVKQRRQAA